MNPPTRIYLVLSEKSANVFVASCDLFTNLGQAERVRDARNGGTDGLPTDWRILTYAQVDGD